MSNIIDRRMTELNISNTKVARETGASLASVGRWRSGAVGVSSRYIDTLARLLNLSIAEILSGEEDVDGKSLYPVVEWIELEVYSEHFNNKTRGVIILPLSWCQPNAPGECYIFRLRRSALDVIPEDADLLVNPNLGLEPGAVMLVEIAGVVTLRRVTLQEGSFLLTSDHGTALDPDDCLLKGRVVRVMVDPTEPA